jgi:hypothetical protein
LILYPAANTSFKADPALGAGGPGPAGGGGGSSGSGDVASGQRLQYVELKSPAPDAVKSVVPPPPPIPTPPKPEPTVTPPKPAITPPIAPAAPASGTAVAGTGAGTGGEGTGGAGPGSGGGIGSGIGTGTGSSTGLGTGGGPGTNHPPTPTQFFLPPLPAPPSLKGYHLIAWFDVDEKGAAKLLSFNPSPDGGYNRRLREVLLALKFRPGVTPAGVPVRDTVDIHFIF